MTDQRVNGHRPVDIWTERRHPEITDLDLMPTLDLLRLINDASGRLATLDAAELAPTFGLEPGRVVAHHVGGRGGLETSVAEVEDDHGSGRADAAGLTSDDLALGLTASGRTPTSQAPSKPLGKPG